MECIYGQRTGLICSRDNFATRPEAFYIKLQDQNQTDSSEKSNITDNIDGSSSVNLAAGYNYLVEINATSHNKEKEAVRGYIATNDISLTWSSSASGCNDESNITTNANFYNGTIESNISLPNVGEYILKVEDDTWGIVDRKPIEHHDGNFTDDDDCILDDDVVAKDDESADNKPLNGCVIKSKHHNQNLDVNYKEITVISKPYTFKIEPTETIGLNDDTIDSDSYIYMANMITNNYADENMSYHIDAKIIASGYDNTALSNFVDACYSEDVNLSIKSSDRSLSVPFKYTFINKDANKHTDGNLSNDDNMTLSSDNFVKELNGTMISRVNLNYDRSVDKSLNPQKIDFTQIVLQINGDTYADLKNDYSVEVKKDIDDSIKYLYGRAHISRNKYNEDNDRVAYIYYETYCQGSSCDKTLLPDGTTSRYSDDPRWFINTKHTSDYGTAGDTNQKGYVVGDGPIVQHTAPLGNHQDKLSMDYDGSRSYPYITTMEHNASNWLIYNKYKSDATKNEFQVEFTKKNNAWAGKNITNTTTKSTANTKIIRKMQW